MSKIFKCMFLGQIFQKINKNAIHMCHNLALGS
jgi:hypothetical protein